MQQPLATWPIYTVVHCFFLLAHVTILIIVNNCPRYNVNNALGGQGSRPPGAWLKHRAFDNLATGLRPAAKLSQAPCFSQAPEGLDPRPPVRYSLNRSYKFDLKRPNLHLKGVESRTWAGCHLSATFSLLGLM